MGNSANWSWTLRANDQLIAPMSSSRDVEKGLMGIEDSPAAALESNRDENKSTTGTKEEEGSTSQTPVDTKDPAPSVHSGSMSNDAIESEHENASRPPFVSSLARRASFENIAEMRIQSKLMESKKKRKPTLSVARRSSYENIAEMRLIHSKLENPRKSIEPLVNPDFADLPRPEQREKIMQYLRQDDRDSVESGRKVPQGSRPASIDRLLALADEQQSQRLFKFNRFERLCLLDLLMAQDHLMRLDEQVQYEVGNKDADYLERHLKLHKSIQTYGCALALAYHSDSLTRKKWNQSKLFRKSPD